MRITMVKVSVIIPCYNSGRYLQEAVESALKQTFQDIEVIVIDDGSVEQETQQVLELVVKQDRVKFLRQENQGPSSARNFGIRECIGQYFLPLDADDLIEPGYVADALDVMERAPEVGIVYCRADLIGDLEGPWNLPEFSWPTILIHNLIFNASLFRKSDWEAVGGYDESMRAGREDHDFVMRILGLGRTVNQLAGTYFHYRRYADTRNDLIGQSRERLIEASAAIFRNNIHLYADHAEDLFEFIFNQQDQIADLKYRYILIENFLHKHPALVDGLKQIRRALRKAIPRSN
jgi:glycosyltransferase involved in cell wall biosynthesis